MDDIQRVIGSAFIDAYGAHCLKVVGAGYNLQDLYDPGKAWGDFSKVLLALAVVEKVKDYNAYLTWFAALQLPNQQPVSVQAFSRFTGIKSPRLKNTSKQTVYNERYRLKTLAELEALRQSNALKWIDDNLDAAVDYIKTKKKY